MGYFKELNQNINVILKLIFKNQDLLKYLKYGDELPLSNPDIISPRSLINENIFLTPKTPDAITEQCSILNIYFISSKPYRKNSGFRELYLCFDIMCHLDIWMLDDSKIRPYCICEEIDTMFNNQQISELSLNRVYFENDVIVKYSDYFYGYRLTYKLSSDSNVGCRE